MEQPESFIFPENEEKFFIWFKTSSEIMAWKVWQCNFVE
jgi:hypothetical protein